MIIVIATEMKITSSIFECYNQAWMKDFLTCYILVAALTENTICKAKDCA